MSKIIALDVGHGLKTPGKQTPNGIKEWTLNDKVADKITQLLSDYDVKIIRLDNNEGKVDEPLSERLNRYLKLNVDLVISIHHNALKNKWSTATGIEVWVDRNCTAADLKLAKLIYKKLVKYTKLKGRGIKKENFYVINQNKITAVLVEGGFMDGKKDYKIITSDAGQTAYAKAVVESVIEFLSLKKKSTVAKPAPKPAITYYKKYIGTSGKVDVVLKAVGVPAKYYGSWKKRKVIASKNGIKLYVGTATQNKKLISLAKQGKLKKV